MYEIPAVNPNVQEIADTAKHYYATATQRVANMQYRLAELAGMGQPDAEENMRLQNELYEIHMQLYFGTLSAVRDNNSPDCVWDESDNTYTDGRIVKVQDRIEPEESANFCWDYNPFLLMSGAIYEYPRGVITYIAPVKSRD